MKINGLISESIDYINPVSITDTANLDFNKHYVISVTSADKTMSLPAVANNGGKLISIQIDSSTTKLITIDGNSSELIDGAQTRVMWASESCTLLCNGTSWNKIAGKSIPMLAYLYQGSNQSISSGQASKCNIDTVISTFDNASMSDTTNKKITIRRSSNYNMNFGVHITNLAASNGMQAFIYKNNAGWQYTDQSTQPWGPGTKDTRAVMSSYLASSDYLELYTVQHGATATLLAGDTNTFLIIQEIIMW